MILFHGSSISVPQPDISKGRKNLDFGQGFYLTELQAQAEAWAGIIASRKGREVLPIVSKYEFDIESAIEFGARTKRFAAYDMEWLDYVVSCRNGRDAATEFDIVEGGVANDNVIDTVEDYEKNVITAQQALGQLQYKQVNHQLCILNQDIIDRFLHFTESYTP